MQVLTLDFETSFSDDYTLKKMTTEAYVRDRRFEPLLLAARLPDGTCTWVPQEHIVPFLAQFDWSQTAVLGHHQHFDCLILSHHYGVRPALILDTLGMARAQIGNHLPASLDALAKHFGAETKSVPYQMFKGRSWVNLFAHERQQLGDGAAGDCRITWDIFNKLAVGFPKAEYLVIDRFVRLFTEPMLVGDVPLLHEIQVEEETRKMQQLLDLGVVEADLQSTAKFVEFLEAEGVEIEFKTGKNGPNPAVAKTDEFMKGLLDHDNSRVAALAEARLGVKSTIAETRAGRLADMGQRGNLCVYLKYCGAHTTRFSGGDALNFQNFPGGHRSRIRRAVVAPRGYVIVTVDSSQGEARILNYVAGQEDIVQAFREKRDIYSEGAAHFYNRPITKKDNPKERQLGKIMELMLGFGAGAAKFQATCRAGALGGEPILLEDMEAEAAVTSYRDRHPFVVDYWKMAGRMIARLAGGDRMQWGPLEVETGRIICPNGLSMWYPELKFNEAEIEGWSYRTRNGRSRMFGPRLVENVVQMMHRVAVVEAIMEIVAESGLRLVLMSHDDASFLVPDNQHVEATRDWLCEKFRKAPTWLPGIPFDAEAVIGATYDK